MRLRSEVEEAGNLTERYTNQNFGLPDTNYFTLAKFKSSTCHPVRLPASLIKRSWNFQSCIILMSCFCCCFRGEILLTFTRLKSKLVLFIILKFPLMLPNFRTSVRIYRPAFSWKQAQNARIRVRLGLVFAKTGFIISGTIPNSAVLHKNSCFSSVPRFLIYAFPCRSVNWILDIMLTQIHDLFILRHQYPNL